MCRNASSILYEWNGFVYPSFSGGIERGGGRICPLVLYVDQQYVPALLSKLLST
jgi:hypothetical protein